MPSPALFPPGANFLSSFDSHESKAAGVDPELLAVLESIQREDYDAALAKGQAVVANSPDSSAAHEVLGVVMAKQNRLDEALTELRKAADLAPLHSTPWTKMGDIHLAKQDRENAKTCLLQATALNPADYRAHQRLGLIFEEEGQVSAAIDHFEKGIVGPPGDYIGIKVESRYVK